MPNTFTGLLLFVVLLLPGLAFTLAKERNTPYFRRSPFRESVEIVAASIVLNSLVVVAFSALRIVWPSATPDVGRLIRESISQEHLVSTGEYYLVTEFGTIAAWIAGLLLIATSTGLGSGLKIGSRPPHRSKMSSWVEMFETWPFKLTSSKSESSTRFKSEPSVHVGCVLDDGSYVEGYVKSFNDSADETPDRDLILKGPLMYRNPNSSQARLHGAGAACISAGRVVTMFVTPINPDLTRPAAGPEGEEEQVAAAEESHR